MKKLLIEIMILSGVAFSENTKTVEASYFLSGVNELKVSKEEKTRINSEFKKCAKKNVGLYDFKCPSLNEYVLFPFDWSNSKTVYKRYSFKIKKINNKSAQK